MKGHRAAVEAVSSRGGAASRDSASASKPAIGSGFIAATLLVAISACGRSDAGENDVTRDAARPLTEIVQLSSEEMRRKKPPSIAVHDRARPMQFDLDCRGITIVSRPDGYGRRTEEHRAYYRVDLRAGDYCGAWCPGDKPADLVRADSEQVALSETESPTGDVMSRETVRFRDGRWEDAQMQGTCRMLPFSGFPAAEPYY